MLTRGLPICPALPHNVAGFLEQAYREREPGGRHTSYDLVSEVMQHHLRHITFTKTATKAHTISRGRNIDSAALAGVAQLNGHHSVHERVATLYPHYLISYTCFASTILL